MHMSYAKVREAEEAIAQAKLDVVLASDRDLIDLSKAECSNDKDRQMIDAAMHGKEVEVTALLAKKIREVTACDLARDEVGRRLLQRAMDDGRVDADLVMAAVKPEHQLAMVSERRDAPSPSSAAELPRQRARDIKISRPTSPSTGSCPRIIIA